MAYDLPAGGKRLLQEAHGYLATIVPAGPSTRRRAHRRAARRPGARRPPLSRA